MKDRQPADPGRIKLTLDDGTVLNGILERNDSPQEAGTPLNKANLFDDAAESRYGVETPNEAFNMIGKKWPDVTIPLSGWSTTTVNGLYENQVTVPGMLAVYEPWVGVAYTSADTMEDEDDAFACVKEIETFDGYIIAKAKELPEQNITVRIRGV